MSDYETSAGRPERLYPEAWGVPRGSRFSTERRNWVQRNLSSNPRFKLEQLAQAERRQLRDEIEALDEKLKALGVTPTPIDW